MDYRQLTDEEIMLLEGNNCWAEDWLRVIVADDFNPNAVRNVTFYGDERLGALDKSIEASDGFYKKSGIYNTT